MSPGYRGGNLKSKTIHYSFRNVENFIAKINRYSTLEADQMVFGRTENVFGQGYVADGGPVFTAFYR